MNLREAFSALAAAKVNRVEKVLLIGNSGRGKSFLSNVLMGKELFCHEGGQRGADTMVAPHVTSDASIGHLLYNIPALSQVGESAIAHCHDCIEQALCQFPNETTLALYVVGTIDGQLMSEDLDACRAVKAFVPQLEEFKSAVVVNKFDVPEPKATQVRGILYDELCKAFNNDVLVTFVKKLPEDAAGGTNGVKMDHRAVIEVRDQLQRALCNLSPSAVAMGEEEKTRAVVPVPTPAPVPIDTQQLPKATKREETVRRLQTRVAKHPPTFTALSDAAGFTQPEHYSCVRSVGFANVIYTVTRNETELTCLKHNIQTGKQYSFRHTFANSYLFEGWAEEQFYTTFSMCTLSNRFIFATFRTGIGLAAFVFDTHSCTWSELPFCSVFCTHAGWSATAQFSSIRVVANHHRESLIAVGHSGSHIEAIELVNTSGKETWQEATSEWVRVGSYPDGGRAAEVVSQMLVTCDDTDTTADSRAYVLLRNPTGADLFCVDPSEPGMLQVLPPLHCRSFVTDGTLGWDGRGHVRMLAHRGCVYLTSRSLRGVTAFKYSNTKLVWDQMLTCEDFGDDTNWNLEQYGATLHLSQTRGHLVLSGRSMNGPLTHSLNLDASERGWSRAADAPQCFRDRQGFHLKACFNTYSVIHCGDLTLVSCRATTGISFVPLQLPIPVVEGNAVPK